MKKTLLALAASAAFATPAFAAQCPMLMEQIEAALAAATTLDADTQTAVTAMLEEGRALHESGDHAASAATLQAALAMLGQ